MSHDIQLDEVRLAYTEDPFQRRIDVLRSANIEMRKKNAAGRVGMICHKIDAALTKLSRREKWEPAFVLMALEHMIEAYANSLYEASLEADSKEPE